jgi:hypothetical protein
MIVCRLSLQMVFHGVQRLTFQLKMLDIYVLPTLHVQEFSTYAYEVCWCVTT